MDSDLVNNQYSLSIRIFSDGFSLCVYDEKHTIISRKNIKSEQGNDFAEFLRNMLATNEEIRQKYKDIVIICESGYHTIIPDVFHKTEREREFLKLQHPSLPVSYQTFHNKINSQQSILIFGLEQSITQLLALHFQQVIPESHLVNIINRIIIDGNDKIAIWIRPEEIDCIVYKDHKIILLNKYSYQSSEDITYHILNIHQQLELNPNDIISEVFSDANLLTEKLLIKYIPKLVIKSKQTAHEDYQWKI